MTGSAPMPLWACEQSADFYRMTITGMLGKALLLTGGDRPAAEDILHDAYASLMHNWATKLRHAEHDQRARWMIVCMSRLVVDRSRKDRQLQTKGPKLYEPDRSRATDPEDAALATIPAEACWQALVEMSAIERSAFVLCWAQGYSRAEAAELLDLPTSTVRGALKRARDQLYSIVADQLPFDPRYGSPARRGEQS